jgi:ADP-ribose pyrophosphatase YjhB (NUDIX family)
MRADDLPTVTRLAAYGIIRRDDRLLVCRVAPGSVGEGIWTLPGGGLEFGESPEIAVLREVTEETGFEAAITGQPEIRTDTGVWQRRSGPVRYHTVRFLYPMAITGGAERVEVDGSTDAVAWLTPTELLELRASGRLGDLIEPLIDT